MASPSMKTFMADQHSTTSRQPNQPRLPPESCLLKTTNTNITHRTMSLRMRQSIIMRRKVFSSRLLIPDIH
jgi:hypothetical protein